MKSLLEYYLNIAGRRVPQQQPAGGGGRGDPTVPRHTQEGYQQVPHVV